jgi:hypothetical protein
MTSHKIRLTVITILAAIALIGVIVLIALGQTEGTGFGIVTGILGTLMPALLDASVVETRRRDPSVSAISDDVREADAGRSTTSPPSH